jgi:DNA adenine methylase
MKSIIRWAGSKRRLLPQLRASLPPSFHTYIEPFAGSACLFFDIAPSRAVLADLNDELITTYREIRRDPQRVLSCFRRLPRGEAAYYRIRRVKPQTLSDTECAARFLYLNRFCFNGLYRTNLNGDFNVPYGPPTKPLVRFEDDVVAAAERLRTADLLGGDFEEALSYVERGDVVYLDPPYVLDERRVFVEYLPGSFMRGDLHRLGQALKEIDRRGATFLLSYADSAEAKQLIAPWYYRQVSAQRHIAGFAGARRQDSEILASNQPLQHSE